MRVLIATDGSKEATTALETAARLLGGGDHQVELLCVAPEFYAKAGSQKAGARLRDEYQRRIGAETSQILDQAQTKLRAGGIEATIQSRIGSPAGVIMGLARDYDLVVVGAHDRYERSKPGLGPVASRVVAFAPSAVLVGRELTAERSLRVLVGLDGSAASKQALRLMAAHLRLGAAEVTLAHVVETPWVHLGFERDWFDYSDSPGGRSDPALRAEQELRLEAKAVVEGAQQWLERCGLSATALIEEGDPALEILSEVERGEYDLVVLGATGEADLKHSMLGSVSTKVAQGAPCSVFIARDVA